MRYKKSYQNATNYLKTKIGWLKISKSYEDYFEIYADQLIDITSYNDDS